MAFYKVSVYETISVSKLYTIEADNYDDAFAKALIGDTVYEDTIEELEVINREPDQPSLREVEEPDCVNEAVCENCGKPCEYDTNMCLCKECENVTENKDRRNGLYGPEYPGEKF